MTHDHVGVMLDALLAVPVPDGFTSVYRERHDTVIDHTFRDVTISSDGLDVSTFNFGIPGAYAHISVDGSGDTYTVGVLSTHVGYNVQSAATSSRSPPPRTPSGVRSARSAGSCCARNAAGDLPAHLSSQRPTTASPRVRGGPQARTTAGIAITRPRDSAGVRGGRGLRSPHREPRAWHHPGSRTPKGSQDPVRTWPTPASQRTRPWAPTAPPAARTTSASSTPSGHRLGEAARHLPRGNRLCSRREHLAEEADHQLDPLRQWQDAHPHHQERRRHRHRVTRRRLRRQRYLCQRQPGQRPLCAHPRRRQHRHTTCLTANPCDAKYNYDARDKLLSHQLRAGRTDTYTLDEPGKLLGDNTIRGGNVTTEVKNGTTTSKKYTANQLTEISVGGVTGKYWYDDFGNNDCLTLAAGTQADCSPSDG
jgi:YD repeat-containing protein